MSTTETAFAIVAVYDDEELAHTDAATVEDLADAHEVHLHDLAVVRHDDGHVRIVERERRTARHGAEAGAIAGALLGILFPPALAGLLIGSAVGAVYGGTVGHLWRGLSRSDVAVMGEAVEAGSCALIAVGTAEAMDLVEGALQHSRSIVRREIDAALSDLVRPPRP
ncbi:unannotated protein [freshwater metagenome]|uniref:Unannotated protein n=1 Tax=freshwater metagenome TaxID=449393 RepID=A0A6J7E297_9ZZZZ|nr:DUF1269 domain-containing protein [Actinomycetota bacterium]